MKKLIALAASKNDVNAFLSIYASLLLAYAGNNTKSLKPDLPRWYAEAKPFLDERPDIAAPMTAAYNMLLLGKACKPKQIEALANAASGAAFTKFMNKAVKVSPKQIDLLTLMNKNALADTDKRILSSWKKIHVAITLLNQPSLNFMFHSEMDSKGNPIKPKTEIPLVPKAVNAQATRLAAIVKQVAGRSNCYLTLTEAIALKASDPKLFEKYNELKKVIDKLAKDTTRDLILRSGTDKVPVADLIKKMQSAGVQNNLPVGFTGSFGIVGNKIVAYTKEGKELDRVPYGKTIMNSEYDPKTNNTYVCKPVDDGGMRQEIRTVEGKKSGQDAKFSRMYKYQKEADKHRQAWLKDLMSFDPKRDLGRPSREVASAALVEILYQTKHRIGGKGSTAGEETFGISTVTLGHIKLTADSISMNYAGKKSASQTATVEFTGSPALIQLGKVMHALVEERKGPKGKIIPAKKKSDLVFTYPTKTQDKPILAASISGNPDTKTGKNTYMGSLGIPITAHGFRHEAATTLAKELLATSKFKAGRATQEQVDKWVHEKLKAVAKKLAHTKETKTGERVLDVNTSLKSYIDPEVMHDFYNKLDLRAPKPIPPLE